MSNGSRMPLVVCAAAALLLVMPEALAAQAVTTRTVRCGSNVSVRAECRIDGYVTNVRLVRDHARGKCDQGSGWGFTTSSIWTNNRCVADFEATVRGQGQGPPPKPLPGNARTISCGDASGTQVECRFAGNATDVQLIRDRGRVACREGTNWGHTGTFIWTNRGCRGDFRVLYRGDAAQPGTRRITCGSASGDVSCNPFGQVASVRLVRELSRNRCAEGKSWGYRSDEVWTRSGCRAEFEVRYAVTPQPR